MFARGIDLNIIRGNSRLDRANSRLVEQSESISVTTFLDISIITSLK